ncbi:unnamed protein product [Fusarium langsethiae]|nr:unnamed protein product [Fusarium langsethiae]
MEIIERITEASSGMFLLAELHLRSLKNKKSPKALRSSLAKLSIGSDAYDSAYKDAMTRVAGLGPESEALAKQALLILIFAREPLHTEDLAYALSIEPDSEAIDDENVPDIEDIAGVCAGLIIVDKESNIVRLVHKSAQEYFERHQAQLFPRASETMARLCIKYLGLAVSAPGFDKSVEASWPPFWRYADINWAYHSRCTEEDDKVIKEEDSDVSTTMMVSNLHSVASLAIDLLARDVAGSLASALGKACLEGRHALVELLLTVNDFDLNCQPSTAKPEDGMASDMEVDDDSYDSEADGIDLSDSISVHSSYRGPFLYPNIEDGFFLLICAAGKGDDSMMRILLSHGADPNLALSSGLTALYFAAEKGHENTVSLLLEQPAIDPDHKCNGWTPLLIAASHGHLKCVRLLPHRAKRNYRDKKGENAVCLAAKAGRVEVLKELIKWSDVELDLPVGTEGSSPLEQAFGSRNEEAALILLPYYDANRVFQGGERPLNLAVRAMFIEAVRHLLSRDIEVNAKGEGGQTALHNAAETPIKQVIELILSHPNIDINIRDNLGNTPLMKLLHYPGCRRGSTMKSAIVMRSATSLLSRPELDINIQNLSGDTALLIAASTKDHDDSSEDNDIFSALFHYPGIHREHRNKFGQTILFRAVLAGSRRVEIILKETHLSHQFREVFDDGETLLSLAAKYQWEGQLKWEDIVNMSPLDFMDRKNSKGKTPKQIRTDALERHHKISALRRLRRRVHERN